MTHFVGRVTGNWCMCVRKLGILFRILILEGRVVHWCTLCMCGEGGGGVAIANLRRTCFFEGRRIWEHWGQLTHVGSASANARGKR